MDDRKMDVQLHSSGDSSFEEEEELQVDVEHNPLGESPDDGDGGKGVPGGISVVPASRGTFEYQVSMGIRRMTLRADQRADQQREKILPRVNCAEKIILCLDLSTEMDNTAFKLGDGTKFSPLAMSKRIVEIFVQSKNRIDKKHEFALVVLYEKAVWVKGFVDDPKLICLMLEDIYVTRPCETFDLSSLFDIIYKKVECPEVDNPEVIPPPYIIRVIMLYGRSQCLPSFMPVGQRNFRELMDSNYFFLDLIYIHEPPSEANKCEEIFDALCELDERGTSYLFEVIRNPTRLHDCMAKLLAHPLQRPLQKDTLYALCLEELQTDQ